MKIGTQNVIQTALLMSMSLGTATSMAVADGVVDGSFDQGSINAWTKTNYGTCDDVRFTTLVVDSDALDSDRRGVLTLALGLPEGLQHISPAPDVRQDGIVLDPCQATDFVVLRFDHRVSTESSTAFPGLAVRLEARTQDGLNGGWETYHELAALPYETLAGDPLATGWSTAEVILDLPEDFSTDDLEFAIEFQMLGHSLSVAGQKDCAVIYAEVNIDQVVLGYGLDRGDSPRLDTSELCGLDETNLLDCFDQDLARESISTSLQNSGDVARRWHHWDRDPSEPIRCRPSSGNEVDCLVDFPVREFPYTRSTLARPRDCPADFNHDGIVDGSDLALLLGAWGGEDSCFDLNRNGLVDGADLAYLLGTWNCS